MYGTIVDQSWPKGDESKKTINESMPASRIAIQRAVNGMKKSRDSDSDSDSDKRKRVGDRKERAHQAPDSRISGTKKPPFGGFLY